MSIADPLKYLSGMPTPDGNIRGLNAFVSGASVFDTERAAREERVDAIDLPLFGSEALKYNVDHLARLLENLLMTTMAEEIEVNFVPQAFQDSWLQPPRAGSRGVVCLLSGGMDSLIGTLVSNNRFPNLEAVFCSHKDQSRIDGIVDQLEKETLADLGIPVKRISVPKIGARGFVQLRGFLYCTAAGYWLDQLGGHRIVISEVGPTMYQPRFGPFDSVTRTTDPLVLAHAQEVLSLLLDRRVRILTPFENLTKAEIIAIAPPQAEISKTHSCVSQRFADHDGTCYGCVIRRMATLVAGTKDCSYRANPWIDSGASAGNLLAVMLFSLRFLTQYRKLRTWEVENIASYRKKELFRRFCLEVFAATHIQRRKGDLRADVEGLFQEYLAAGDLGELRNRIAEVRNATRLPNYERGPIASKAKALRSTHKAYSASSR